MEWQPIETAPKDGSCILIWDNFVQHSVIGNWDIVNYTTDDEGWAITYSEVEWNDMPPIIIDHATHWMPLPDGPK